MLVDRDDRVVVRMVMVVLDPILSVRMRGFMPVAMRMVVVVVSAIDVNMRGPAHVQIHRGECLERQGQRQRTNDRESCARRHRGPGQSWNRNRTGTSTQCAMASGPCRAG